MGATRNAMEVGQLTRLDLGNFGEGKSRTILIDVSEWLERWPDAAIGVLVERPDGHKYTAATSVTDGILQWEIQKNETTWEVEQDVKKTGGKGEAQIKAVRTEDGFCYKSRVVQTIVGVSLIETLDPDEPDPMETWVDHAIQAASDAHGHRLAAEAAADIAEQAAETAESHKSLAHRYAESAVNAAVNAKLEADAAKAHRESASADAAKATVGAERAETAEGNAAESARQAKASEQAAAESASSARGSANSALSSAQSAAASQSDALRAEANVEAIDAAFSTAEVEVSMLAPSAAPTGEIEKVDGGMKFVLGIPKSNLAMATFEIDDDMELLMHTPEGFGDIGFTISYDGELEVSI